MILHRTWTLGAGCAFLGWARIWRFISSYRSFQQLFPEWGGKLGKRVYLRMAVAGLLACAFGLGCCIRLTSGSWLRSGAAPLGLSGVV